jgi:glycosyltransferase involved in cell wall biosynthesis
METHLKLKKSYAALIPTYNEEKNIREVVNRCFDYVPEVIVVDDGSIDKTLEQLALTKATVIRQEKNGGKGSALKRGFEYGREKGLDYMITLDGDNQHNPSEILRFVGLAETGDYDLILGCREMLGTDMPYVRRFANIASSWLISAKLGRWIPDSQCGYRALKIKALDGIDLQCNRYDLESEIIQKIIKQNGKIGLVPVSTIYGDETSKVRQIVDPLRFLASLFKF